MLISIDRLHPVLSPRVDPRSFGLPFPVPFDAFTWLAVVRRPLAGVLSHRLQCTLPQFSTSETTAPFLLLPLGLFSASFLRCFSAGDGQETCRYISVGICTDMHGYTAYSLGLPRQLRCIYQAWSQS